MEQLQTIHEIASSSVNEKGSTFFGFLCPIHDFEFQLEKLKEKHIKAVHFVTSSRFFNVSRQIQESFSDDGEPRGSSGMPTLKVLRGYHLVDVGFVSVRYFGGTLLGVGGLVRAYTQSAKQAVLEANLVPYKETQEERWQVPYDKMSHLEYLSKKYPIELIKKSFLADGIHVICKGEEVYLRIVKDILWGKSDGGNLSN